MNDWVCDFPVRWFDDDILYKQCLLRKEFVKKVAWLPVHLAKLGSFVHIKSKDETWLIEKVYFLTKTGAELCEL